MLVSLHLCISLFKLSSLQPWSSHIVLPGLWVVKAFCTSSLHCLVITRLLLLHFCFCFYNSSFKYFLLLPAVSKGITSKNTDACIHTAATVAISLPLTTVSRCVFHSHTQTHSRQLTEFHQEESIISDLLNIIHFPLAMGRTVFAWCSILMCDKCVVCNAACIQFERMYVPASQG